MSFCPTCGRQRDADSRFCGGCGHDFREQAPDSGTAPAAEAPWEATRLDAPLDATRLEPAATAEPDPFATWFAPDVPAPPAGQAAPPPRGWADDSRPGDRRPGDGWQTADTVYATPAHAPSYRPPGAGPGSGYPPVGPGYPPPGAGNPQPGPGYPPRGPDDGERPGRTSRGARAALIIVIVLVVLGAGGAAYAFISRSSTPSAAGPGPAAGRPGASSASPAHSAQASAKASATASARTRSSASASASPSPNVVSVAPGVGSSSATPRVETVLSHFFQGINTHSYTEYTSALDAQERAKQTQAAFSKGYSTTSDSGMTLTSLTATGGGGLAATVTFTSHQAASSSVDHSGCNTWTLTFYLVPEPSGGPGYLDGAAPSGYQPKYADC